MLFQTSAWDLRLFTLLNMQDRNWFFDVLMPILSMSALLWIALAALVAWLYRNRGWRFALAFLLFLAAVMALNDTNTHFLKEEIGRVRPLNTVPGTYYKEDGQWHRLPPDFTRTKKHGSSFPSGHAANSMAAAILVLLAAPKLKPWVFALPLLVGYSRIYLGKHYPSDVLAGWILGLAMAGLACVVWRYFSPETTRR